MKILILQSSPRPKGNTAWMAEEFKNAAEAAGHDVTLVNGRSRGAGIGSKCPAGHRPEPRGAQACAPRGSGR